MKGPAFGEGGAMKVGLLGGKGVGKSYFFQAIVYRIDGPKAASLASFLRGGRIEVWEAHSSSERGTSIATEKILRDYREWRRLDQTLRDTQKWYQLQLRYPTGWLGKAESRLDFAFLDGSGEILAGGTTATTDDLPLWGPAFLDASVMVFCLPYWAAFPQESAMKEADWEKRDQFLREFSHIVTKYASYRGHEKRTHAVSSILALTMADDQRSGIPEVRAKWIDPYLEDEDSYIRRLRSGPGVAQYLANARLVSRHLHERFGESRNEIARIPGSLVFGGGEPWIIPISAVNGAWLSRIESAPSAEVPALRRKMPPVPAHVELPLLLALCDKHNALM